MSDQKVFCASKAVIVKDGKFLVLKQSINGQSFWDLPGGKIEFGESPEETLRRELMEEVRLEVNVHSILGTFHFFREKDNNQVVCITYLCTPQGDSVDITQNPGEDDITEYRWVSKNEFLSGSFPVSSKSNIKDLVTQWNPITTDRST